MNQKKLARQLFKTSVFNRDRHKCMFCDYTENLNAHHIIDRHLMPNGGYVVENGITLCPAHHIDAERFHITEGQDWVEGMHPDDLFKKVNSSRTKAKDASRSLSC